MVLTMVVASGCYEGDVVVILVVVTVVVVEVLL